MLGQSQRRAGLVVCALRRQRRSAWRCPTLGPSRPFERRSRGERVADAPEAVLALRARCRPRRERTAASSAACAFQVRRSLHPTGLPTRGGSPPISSRRVALVQGGRGTRSFEALPRRTRPLRGNSSGAVICSRRKKPWASSSSGVADSSRHVPAEVGDRPHRTVGGVARVSRAAAAGGAPRRRSAGRCRPRRLAASGPAGVVHRASLKPNTTRRCASNGLKPLP